MNKRFAHEASQITDRTWQSTPFRNLHFDSLAAALRRATGCTGWARSTGRDFGATLQNTVRERFDSPK
eukprot:13236350-Alexandrium_andersonii.AAC.1